ncbi:unnamed protein product [Paramecium octaurelia]|uniref:PX domain-containing protein n=1 Tax=Paramecium octaurelia TaxID=43137 RepID=A0A8S1SWY2_PAROT|nr:unnamed protein product [Paramecium octaurelia]
MLFELNQNELRSYQEKYDKVVKAKVNLDFKKTKKIIIGQFSITETQADLILKKVFSRQNSDELDREGFFTTLRYIQCLQNKVDIETCNINTIKLQFPLRVNSKQNLKKSFQPPNPEDLLDKSMIALKNLQNLVKEPPALETQKSSASSEVKNNPNQQIQKEIEEIPENKEKVQQEVVNEIEQCNEQINQTQAKNDTNELSEDDQQIIQNNQEDLSQFKEQNKQYVITEFGRIDVNQSKEIQQNDINFTFGESKPIIQTSSNNEQLYITESYEVPPKTEEIKPDFIEISEDEEDLPKKDESKDIYVWISGYQSFKDGPFSQTYYTYTVCSEIRTDPLQGTYTKYQVNRRYTDFQMLQQYFTKSKLGDIIPSLPEKEGVIASIKSMVVENAEFISQRQEQLQLFLQYLTKYKEDQILLSFLSNDKKFDFILKELRYCKGDNQDEDTFLPDPDEFTRKQKLKEMIAGKSIMDIVDYFKGEKEIEAKFQEEYRQVQQHYKNLENKKLELSKFKQCLNQFYEPIEKFSSGTQLQVSSIITEENIKCAQETQKLFQSNYSKHQNSIMNQVMQIEFQLNSLTYSFEQIQKQIYKWFAEKKRLREEKSSNKVEIQKNDSEEGRLQFVISKTNETLIKLVSQITEDLKGLLKDFVEELTQN